MASVVTHESRHALSRARFFLDKAKSCPGDERVDFEAFIEASIIFARAAVHRFQSKFKGHSAWQGWWDSLLRDQAVLFFRSERNWILKEAPPKIGQKIIGSSTGNNQPTYTPKYAGEYYYFEGPETNATDTVERHLNSLENTLLQAERRFSE